MPKVIVGTSGASIAAAVVLLAGCGGSGGERPTGQTVGAYGVFPATTVPGSAKPSAAVCRQDARIFADDAVQFLAHSGPDAAYPADLYYVNLRGVFADFQAHRCAPAVLGAALERRLTATQRSALVSALPRVMAAVVREGLG